MNPHLSDDRAEYWRSPHFQGLELLHAHYKRHRFNRHFHEVYAFGVIEAGALGFRYRGEQVVAAPGQINLTIPGEAHDGFAACPQGWQYRMFYLDPSLLQRAASEIAGKPRELPFFKQGVIEDLPLAAELRSVHQAISGPHASLLEQQTRLLSFLTKMICRHAQDRPFPAKVGIERGAVARARAYIYDNHSENVTLDDLSNIAGLSRFHFLRVFRKQVGLTPHAYLNQVRSLKAKEMLANGLPIVQAALDTGFVDQSHLNRIFKKTYGVTPGKYRNSILDQ
jgi:AraC-like DNA-binding protein